MIKKIILYTFLFLTTVCNSQTVKEGWNSFDGYIFENDVVVNIYRDSIGNLTGDYCNKKEENRIPLKGRLKGDKIFLDAFTENQITAKFSGKIDEEKNIITGKWSSTIHSDKVFFLRLSSQTSGNLENKYSIGTNEEVEQFFKKTKASIIKDDKDWLSKNTEFPIDINVGKKKIRIKNQKQFIANYTQIISKSVKKRVAESCICDIFSNSDGAMIALGAIWINELDNQSLKITAINN